MVPGDAVGSTSAMSLDALLEESNASTTVGVDELAELRAEQADSEPVPSLASLLLSTAESLAARSTSTPSPAAPPPRQPQPQQFRLASSPQSLLGNPISPTYLSSLLTQPLTALQALPTSLANLSTSLDNDLSSLAYTRYSSFLLSYTSAQSISASFATLSDSLAALLDSTSALEGAASSFSARVTSVRDKRERFARVRERMEEVEELLEAPGVVDACVRAGYWSEAIDVAVRLEELHKRLKSVAAPGQGEGRGALLLLNRVRDEVGVALLSLRARVLESLVQRTLKLPGAVRGIGILRRISERAAGEKRKELDEEGLRLVFLTARWRCLRTELETIEAQMAASGIHLGSGSAAIPHAAPSVEENEERTRWTKRWVEAWREIIGETVGMYSEVFLSSTSLPPSSPAPNVDFALPAPAVDPAAPLHLFLSQALESLSTTLAHAYPAIHSPSSLSSLLTQLTYCSHSFARHGLDFREVLQLRERVELRLGRIIAADFESAGRKWEKEWRSGWENSGGTGTTAAKARRSGRVPIADWLVMPEGLSSLLSTPLPSAASSTSTPPPQWHHQPTPSLALLPPLARFLNAHATALNALRLLPPASLYLPLRRAQAAELDRATQVLAAFTDAWLAALNATPLLAQNGFSPLPGAGGGGSAHKDALSDDEQQLLREREDERRVVAAAIAWFGRVVVPWCEGALGQGVYAELVQSGRLGDEASKRDEGIKEAVRRCESLVARIEGREWIDEEAHAEEEKPASPPEAHGAPHDDEVGASAKTLPVLDAPAVPPEPPSVAAVTASVALASTADTGAPLHLDDAIPTTAAPVDFSLPAVDDAPLSPPPPPGSARVEVNGGGKLPPPIPVVADVVPDEPLVQSSAPPPPPDTMAEVKAEESEVSFSAAEPAPVVQTEREEPAAPPPSAAEPEIEDRPAPPAGDAEEVKPDLQEDGDEANDDDEAWGV
ncbi:hypothetical protein JCM10213_004607 [Rhodosporidiobolus nylandii]